MEQAHTRLIAQLNERIAAPDNTPLYLKFAETVKNAVRSGVLEHGNILPGERDLSQLTGVSRITVRKAMQALEEEGVVTRSRGYGTQINNIFEYSLKEARGFSQQVVLRGQKPNTLWVNKRVVKCPEEVANHLSIRRTARSFCSSAFAMWMTMRCRLKSPGCRLASFPIPMRLAFRCTITSAVRIFSRSAPVHGLAPACRTASFRRTLRWTKKYRCW